MQIKATATLSKDISERYCLNTGIHQKLSWYWINVAYHHAHKIRNWVEKHPKLELYFLPPYSPDLNAVERAWWYMRKKITHNRFIKSLKERKAVFWKMFSHYQKPNKELKLICEINY